MMLLYEYQLRDEFDRAEELAERLRANFDAGVDCQELMLHRELLDAECKQLRRMLPAAVTSNAFERHLKFLEYYLRQDQPANCRPDIDDICSVDLPKLEKAFRDWAAGQLHYDTEFVEKLGRLLADQHFDSAVRKAFVLLKERLARTFGVRRDLDGRDLVNQIFGGNGCLAGRIPDPERESMRNLLDGLYGMFRNRFDHEDVDTDWCEVETVLSAINWTLRKVESCPSVIENEGR